MNFWDDFWGNVEDSLSSAWDVIEDFFEDLWDAIKRIVVTISDFVSEYWLPLILVVITVAVFYYTGGFTSVTGGLTTLTSAIGTASGSVVGYAATMQYYVAAFLELIHFKLLVSLHNILMVLNPEYKAAVTKLYNKIAGISRDLGLGAAYMLLALQDARNLVVGVGSLMGKNFDMCELEWVQGLTSFLNEISTMVRKYETDPGSLITDIQVYFDTKYVQAKSGFQLSLLKSLETSVAVINETAIKLKDLKGDFEKAILRLPEQISKPIYKAMEDSFDNFDTFMGEKYDPAFEQLTGVTDILRSDFNGHSGQLSNINGLMANPGEMLSNINQLPEIQRLEQESQITEISTRALRTEATDRNKIIDDTNKELQLIADALKKERKPPDFLQLEYHGPPKPISIANGVFTSWQVGDY